MVLGQVVNKNRWYLSKLNLSILIYYKGGNMSSLEMIKLTEQASKVDKRYEALLKEFNKDEQFLENFAEQCFKANIKTVDDLIKYLNK